VSMIGIELERVGIGVGCWGGGGGVFISRLREIEGVQTLLLEDGAGGTGMILVSCVLGEKDIREDEIGWGSCEQNRLGRGGSFVVGFQEYGFRGGSCFPWKNVVLACYRCLDH